MTKRSHDNLYLKDLKHFKKPKYLTKFFIKIVKKKKFNSLMDVGCSNGSFLKYISEKIPLKKYIGTDINSNLLKLAKKENEFAKIYYDDITSYRKKKIKADIVHSVGVLNIFDNVKNTITQLISRCNRGGYVYISHYFNDYDIDYLVRYRDNLNSKKKRIDEQGWNLFSKKTISRILQENNYVSKFKFIEVKFPSKIYVKKNKNDLMRSWTTHYNGKKYFVNGLNMFNKIYFLEIKLK